MTDTGGDHRRYSWFLSLDPSIVTLILFYLHAGFTCSEPEHRVRVLENRSMTLSLIQRFYFTCDVLPTWHTCMYSCLVQFRSGLFLSSYVISLCCALDNPKGRRREERDSRELITACYHVLLILLLVCAFCFLVFFSLLITFVLNPFVTPTRGWMEWWMDR